MAISRYSTTPEQILDDSDYKRVYSDKFNQNKRHFLSKVATLNLEYPEFSDILNFSYSSHIWSMGDRYYKLAYQYYGSAQYWWVIAWFNKKPTESHVEVGEIIRVPKPIGEVLATLGY
tara:strand:- start:529 stop:882 length:354 start_codon:yes stop_codon:yes gene_type:complete